MTTAVIYEAYERNVCLYVGCAVDVRRRMNRHRRTSPWYPRTTRIVLRLYNDLNEARRAEAARIYQLRPVFNKAHNPASWRVEPLGTSNGFAERNRESVRDLRHRQRYARQVERLWIALDAAEQAEATQYPQSAVA